MPPQPANSRTPDGHGKLELTKYHTPAAVGAGPENPPPNTLGLHRVMFAVDDIDDTVARLRAHGAGLLGEVAQYQSSFRLCYLRGPRGHHRRPGRTDRLTRACRPTAAEPDRSASTKLWAVPASVLRCGSGGGIA
jgi:hypothetical protein